MKPMSHSQDDRAPLGFAVDLSERIAVVSGANRGIGRSIAFELANHRATVVCAARSLSDGVDLATEILAAGGTAMAAQLDVRDEDSIRAMTKLIAHEFGKADILVNNAGMGHLEAVGDVTKETWNDVVETNLAGPFFCSQHLIPLLRHGKAPTIINIGSVNGVVTMARLAAYCASKAALHHLTRQMALELGSMNIRVNCVVPGFVRTDLFELSHSAERKLWIEALHALRRVGEPDEIARVVAFLASNAASFITGAVILVDGGLTTQFGLDQGPGVTGLG